MNRPSWRWRRAIVIATLAFCAFIITLIVFIQAETRIAETIVTSAFLLAGSVIGSYVFGAVWDDRNVMKQGGLEAYQETN